MVCYKGIKINVVSQLDARPLPEYSTARSFNARGCLAACCVAIQPGAKLWLEYSLDGPHPDKAAYFFKLLIDGKVINSWDCTAKHEYCGKTVFLLHTDAPSPSGPKVVVQKSIAFAKVDESKSPRVSSDCIEIRVHRIEHRRRVRDLPVDAAIPKSLGGSGALRIVNHGMIEPDRPVRRYQYQLLDPQDEPFAAFRFYCRTQEYLKRHQIVDVDQSSVSSSLGTPNSGYFDARSSPLKSRDIESAQTQYPPSTPTKTLEDTEKKTQGLVDKTTWESPTYGFSSPAEGPIIKIKGSIEDLPSTVPRSPQAVKSSPSRPLQNSSSPSPFRNSSPLFSEVLDMLRNSKRRSPNKTTATEDSPTFTFPNHDQDEASLPPPKFEVRKVSHTSTGSPVAIHATHRRHKPSNLKLTLDGFSMLPESAPAPALESKERRPLSPFTPGGILRKISSNSLLRSQRSVAPNTALVVPAVHEIDKVVKTPSYEKNENGVFGGENGTPPNEKPEGTLVKGKICTFWNGGRPTWTKKQRVEGGS